jgi:hypothetical protein
MIFEEKKQLFENVELIETKLLMKLRSCFLDKKTTNPYSFQPSPYPSPPIGERE